MAEQGFYFDVAVTSLVENSSWTKPNQPKTSADFYFSGDKRNCTNGKCFKRYTFLTY